MQSYNTEDVDDEVYHLFGCLAEGCEPKERSNGAKGYCRFRFWVKVTDENVRVVGGKLARSGPEYKHKYRRRPTIERFFSAAKKTRLLGRASVKPSKVLLHVGLSVLTYLATMLMHAQDGRIEDIRKMVFLTCKYNEL